MIQKELELLTKFKENAKDSSVLYELVCFYFYEKKDDINAAFYAQQHFSIDNTTLPFENYNICKKNITHKRS